MFELREMTPQHGDSEVGDKTFIASGKVARKRPMPVSEGRS